MRLNVLKTKIMNRLNWHCLQLKGVVMSVTLFRPRVMSVEESISRACIEGLSVTRFGDGELNLMCGENLNFQKYDADLARKLGQAITSANPKVLVCIPDCFTRESRKNLCSIDQRFWQVHMMKNRYRWIKRLKRGRLYGNALLSRIYSINWDKAEAERYYRRLEKIWTGKDIVIIEGAFSRLGVGNDCFVSAHSIRRIIAPATNSFSRYAELLDAAKSVEGNPLFILALGPSATAMVPELADSGCQAVDLGHLDIEYEWMRRGVKEKVPVRGKYSNEAYLSGKSASEVTGDLTPEELNLYKSQIIADFS